MTVFDFVAAIETIQFLHAFNAATSLHGPILDHGGWDKTVDWWGESTDYHMITDTVAIGNQHSLYDQFDVVVNLNYPRNLVVEHRHIKMVEYTDKTIWYVGIIDTLVEQGQLLSLLKRLVPELARRHGPGTSVSRLPPVPAGAAPGPPRILFHCQAGHSRSTSLALGFMMTTMDNLGLGAALQLAKAKRNVSQPNPKFMIELQQFEEYMKLT